jgi:hypothetical protein
LPPFAPRPLLLHAFVAAINDDSPAQL